METKYLKEKHTYLLNLKNINAKTIFLVQLAKYTGEIKCKWKKKFYLYRI